MEFKGIEHYDIFPDDVIIFWADVSNPPKEIQAAAREIESWNFSPNCFGLCVNYSFAAKKCYLVTDTGNSPEDCRNIFYMDQDGDKHWFRADIPQDLLNQVFDECGKTAKDIEKALSASRTDPPATRAAQAKPTRKRRMAKGRDR